MPDQTPNDVEIFAAALSLPAAQRAAFLDATCGVNSQLRARIDEYLKCHEQSGPLDEVPPGLAATMQQLKAKNTVGTQIGPYKLREQIGEGGMGVVYVAEQTEPVKRKVALKIIKPGMASKDVVARFEAERQALAMMEHPNIAKVHDGGATDTGQPYFVMELVKGLPITEYCDDHMLPTRDRLKLFATVCRAIQHAHQKGIIHRDLKPSNIIVSDIDDAPVPKVIDFGVAKAVSQTLTEETVYTEFSQIIGTPLYMSPEQTALGVVDIDTRSDVYALGVLLYELLTGNTPFDCDKLKSAGFDEMRRIIREDEPLKPSAMVSTLKAENLSTISQRRGSDPRKLSESLSGELDWLVMKALEKDRNRRYEAASALAADIERYLSGDPIEARPKSTGYRLRKLLQRQKAFFVSAAVVLTSLLFGSVVSTWQAIRATTAAQEAAQQSTRAESALAESRLAQAELALEKGQLLGERGEINVALLWMAHALRVVSDTSEELRHAILVNLSAWSQKMHPLKLMLSLEGRVDRIAYLTDPERLLTVSRIGNKGFVVRKWLVSSGMPLGEPFVHSGGMVTAIEFDDVGGQLVAGYMNGNVELFHVATGGTKVIYSAAQSGPITALAFSPHAEKLLCASGANPIKATEDMDENSSQIRGPGLVQIIDVSSGSKLFAKPLEHQHIVWTAAFNPDGNSFVTESGEWLDPYGSSWARFWDMSGSEICAPVSHPTPALKLVYSPDGQKLLSGHWDNRARLWSVNSDIITLDQEIKCEGPVIDGEFRPNKSNQILLGDFGGTARIWDINNQQIIGPVLWHRQLIRCSHFSPDGRYALCGTHGGEIRLWELDPVDGDQFRSTFMPSSFPLAIDHISKRVLIHGTDNLIRWHDALTGEQIGPSVLHEGPILRGATDTKGEIIAVISEDRKVSIWNLATGTRHDLAFDEPAFSVDVSPSGSTVAVGCFADYAILWDVRKAMQKPWKLKHQAHSGPIFSVKYSPNEKYILTGGADSTARLWNLQEEKEIRRFTQIASASGAEFSPDGNMVVICGGGEGARVWRVEDASPLGLPLRHEGQVTSARFSPDGSMILTGGMDGAARVWDVATGKQLGPALRHRVHVGGVAFWPDGRTLVTNQTSAVIGSEQGERNHVRYWPVPQPLVSSVEQIEPWVQTITGMKLDENGGMSMLSPKSWQTVRERLVRNSKSSMQGSNPEILGTENDGTLNQF